MGFFARGARARCLERAFCCGRAGLFAGIRADDVVRLGPRPGRFAAALSHQLRHSQWPLFLRLSLRHHLSVLLLLSCFIRLLSYRGRLLRLSRVPALPPVTARVPGAAQHGAPSRIFECAQAVSSARSAALQNRDRKGKNLLYGRSRTSSAPRRRGRRQARGSGALHCIRDTSDSRHLH